jgi:MFS family permease
MIGYMFGGVFLSYFSDKNGRKPVALVSIAVELVATLSCALSVNFWQYLASRFFIGFGTTGGTLSLGVLCKMRRRER